MDIKPGSPYDINGACFNADIYVKKVLKESNLKQVMDHEREIHQDIQSLHSDMQTLVYENYNKFIIATNTIGKMKNDFKNLEGDMEILLSKMDEITKSSETITSSLHANRDEISKLSETHKLLKRFQFVYTLPTTLKKLLENGDYAQVVQEYLHALRVLTQYGNQESLKGILKDCNDIVKDLMKILYSHLRDKDLSGKELAKSVDLLLQLNEPVQTLSKEFLLHSKTRLFEYLDILQLQVENLNQDMIQFIDLGSDTFLSQLCLVIASFKEMFIDNLSKNDDNEEADITINQLNIFVDDNMTRYLEIIQQYIDKNTSDTAILVRALDRFYKKLQAIGKLFSYKDYTCNAMEIISSAARRQCKLHLAMLKANFNDKLATVRQSLASLQKSNIGVNSTDSLASLTSDVIEKVKGILKDISAFLEPEVSFSSKHVLRQSISVDNVREGIIVGFLHYLSSTARSYTLCTPCPPPFLFLLLTKMCLEYQTSGISGLLHLVDENYEINKYFNSKNNNAIQLSSEAELAQGMHNVAQDLVNYYVRVEGLSISQMLKKSVETRDWLHSFEPRTVRAVMKRVVEEITAVDSQVGELFEEGTRTDRSSDSSRRTQMSRHIRAWSSGGTATNTQTFSAINRLFSERIDIFSPVQFSRVSITTGIIKISLKTLLECVRLRTFNRFGLQQMQVDIHYLQLYLWRFVSDENLVHLLLDEILSSSVHRCLSPALMEPSVIEIICEKG
ncbi:vacuolar protein sorting-associated protein 51 homolog isoform X2 [Adelges cooleyi]|uniref:vacuolar protein sorting-associated protein 51 homolog isoform X1 n=1 Tax=Adelges cooleyi TaxID=133065 RepID=UPI00218076C1|nr:vacuolar protein sorting-associated protein 51 homolog isoform X1 [Adelges cooleyi]XP_050428494.1 vacuolar protein sorting-associated protein 51 homolog isoform X1 [Adelges cooleyi]XP_050428495.1 vacuolar protein sorting-associated protein 51 homolog isoform X2 [Adelges cooleyi]